MSQDSLPQGYTTQSETALVAQSLRAVRLAEECPHEDLLAFLSTVQELGVELLPLTWYPRTTTTGGFSTINSSAVHAQLTFVFKRLSEREKLGHDGISPLTKPLRELRILAHKEISNDANIVNLEGVCWEVSPGEEQIFPVLVFERSTHGDLYNFRNSADWKFVSVNEKISIATDILKGLALLHACGVIHGDIKPHNVLVTLNDQSSTKAGCKSTLRKYSAKLCDFGGSSIHSDSTICYPPGTYPWTAPEHHHRGHDFVSSSKMDIYSFALVLLWILVDREHDATDAGSATRLIEQLQQSEDVITTAEQHVTRLPCNQETKVTILEIFSQALCPAFSRSSDCMKILAAFQDEGTLPQIEDIDKVPHLKVHASFSVSQNFLPLIWTNFLVRQLVLTCLEQKATSSSCKRCVRKAAFQAAFCRYVGFGSPRETDHEKAGYWTKISKRSWEDVEAEAEDEVSAVQYSGLSARFPRLGLDGFTMIGDHVDEYHKSGYDINAVREVYRREISDYDSVFEEEPLVTMALKTILANLLATSGLSDEAEKLYRDVIRVLEESTEQGPRDRATLSSKCRFANWLRLQGRFQEGEAVIRNVLDDCEDIQTAETIEYRAGLGAILHSSHQWNQATKVLREVYELCLEHMGINHMQTLFAMTNLACCYREAGNLEEAEALDKKALEQKRSILNNDEHTHFSTITSAANLALTYSKQGKWEQAKELEIEVLQERIQYGGHSDPATLTAKGNLAETYVNLGNLDEAQALYESVLETRREVIGKFHPDTLVTVENLASLLLKRKDPSGAEEFLRTTLDDNDLTTASVETSHTEVLQSLFQEARSNKARPPVGLEAQPSSKRAKYTR